MSDDWIEIALAGLDECEADAADAVLAEVFPEDVVVESNADDVTVRVFVRRSDPRLDTLPALERRLAAAGVAPDRTLRVGTMPARNWGDAWRELHEPLAIGDRITIQPPWCDDDRAETTGDTNTANGAPDRIVVRIDPGMAFGMGTHASTRLALDVLDRAFALDAPATRSPRALDVGAGSGILALTCLALGADHAVCCDIDPNAGEAIAHNARLNGRTDQTVAFRGSLDAIRDGEQFDLVVANIVAPILLALLPAFVRLLTPSGRLVLSGIFLEREPEILDATRALDLSPELRAQADGFVALAFRRV